MLSKILLLVFTSSLLFGCGKSSNKANDNQPDSESGTTEVDQTKDSGYKCPDKPGKLDPSNVEEITFNGNETTISGQLTADEALGYLFEGKEGQKLTYSTEDELCMWIYTPNNKLLNGVDLPSNGSYTVQVSIPKGSRTFELTMELRSSEISYGSNNSNSSNNSNQSKSYSLSNTKINNTSSSRSGNTPSITRQKAVNLIQEWQQAKRQIFAPPYNRNLGEKLLTGKAYGDNIRKPDGSGSSVDWLENNGAYYTYRLQAIDEATNFNDLGGSAYIDVVTKEQRTLCIDGKPSQDNTAYDKRLVRYNLQYVEGQWKISNYETRKVINDGYNPNKSCQIKR
jgi:hypothetical protein